MHPGTNSSSSYHRSTRGTTQSQTRVCSHCSVPGFRTRCQVSPIATSESGVDSGVHRSRASGAGDRYPSLPSHPPVNRIPRRAVSVALRGPPSTAIRVLLEWGGLGSPRLDSSVRPPLNFEGRVSPPGQSVAAASERALRFQDPVRTAMAALATPKVVPCRGSACHEFGA
jgi:hypothetical protein